MLNILSLGREQGTKKISFNLLIETIKDMQRKQDESLRDIQFKLNEMNQIKGDLKAER